MSMLQNREGGFHPTSPHSISEAAESFKGTPDTRITAYSPEDKSSKSASRAVTTAGTDGQGTSSPLRFRVTSPPSLTLEKPKSILRVHLTADKDPFVSSHGPIGRPVQKLSPTASCFSPFPRASAIEDPSGDQVLVAHSDSTSNSGHRTGPALASQPTAFVHNTLSTDMGLSRCLVIEICGKRVQNADIELYLANMSAYGLQTQGMKEFDTIGDRGYIRFGNIRDACQFSQNARLGGDGWNIRYVSSRDFSQIVNPAIGGVTSHEGQLHLTVFGPPSLRGMDLNQLQTFLQSNLQLEGDLFAFKVQAGGVEGSLLNAVIEFCDNDASLRAVSKLNGCVIQGIQFCLSLYRPDIPSMRPTALDVVTAVNSVYRSAQSTPDLVADFQRMALPPGHNAMASRTPVRAFEPSQLGMTAYGTVPLMLTGIPMNSPYLIDHQRPGFNDARILSNNYPLVPYGYHQRSPVMQLEYPSPRQAQYHHKGDGRRQHAVRVSRVPYYTPPSQHNHVDVDRIREGIDVRTTIMLRNIPNKVDQAMLKKIIDESSWGKYDFMYLRIDFANDCNVGYAFINFVDPLDIIDFVTARGNQRWNCFKSDKVAEISYATIQGKDCLVQKFRNSSVMLEAAHYRPKLYFTCNGPLPDLAGQEEPFPDPDNQSKMKRSCENAEHVGLFTPNAGQHFRDEQRRRRSQYDRGTRLAALEEYSFDSFQQNPYAG